MIAQEWVGVSRAPWSDRDAVADDDQPQPPPAVRDDGEPNPVCYECPGDRALDYEMGWYCLPDVPDALVCTHCHARHLERTGLERFFRPTRRGAGARCSFGTPRVLRSLLPAARQTGSPQDLRAYLGRRAAIADCRGARGASGEHKTKWFRLARNEIEGFIVCEACHEDVIQATPFGGPGFFITYGASQPVGQTWSCALSVPYARRALLRFAGRPGGWDEWINTTARRLRLPPCAGGMAVEHTSREWVRARHPIRNQNNNRDNPLVFCEACYLDRLALTALDHDFEFLPPTKPQPQQAKSPSPLGKRHWTCGTATPSLTMALATAIRRKEFGVFKHVADTVVSSSASPPCTSAASQGVVGGGGIAAWYTLAGEGCDEFRVCPGCHAGAFEILGLGHFLQPESQHQQQRQQQRMKQAALPGGKAQGWPGGSSTDMTTICSLNPAHPRYEQYVARLAEAVNLGVWSRFSTYVRQWASVLPCPRAELVAGRRWYGYGDLTVCPECWGTFCAPASSRSGSYHVHSSSYSSSSYASSSTTTSPTTSSSSASVLSSASSSYSSALSPLPVPLRNELIAKSRMCCMYSPRMRAKWREACARGDPTELVELSRLRMAIYGQTVLQIKTLRHLQQEESSKAQAGRGGSGRIKGPGGSIGAGSDLATNMKIIQLSQKWADVE